MERRRGVHLLDPPEEGTGDVQQHPHHLDPPCDEVVLDALQNELLGTRNIEELLTLVEHTPDISLELMREKDRLKGEINRMVDSIASGIPASVVAPKVREREKQIRKYR